MEFDSFEQALQVCMTAPPHSDEQEAALVYCLENAPAALKEKIAGALTDFHRERGSETPDPAG